MACLTMGDDEMTNNDSNNVFSGGFNSDGDFGDDFDGDGSNFEGLDDDDLKGVRRR